MVLLTSEETSPGRISPNGACKLKGYIVSLFHFNGGNPVLRAGLEKICSAIVKAFIFFACLYARLLDAKKTNQKKGHPSLGPPAADYPPFLVTAGRERTRALRPSNSFLAFSGRAGVTSAA